MKTVLRHAEEPTSALGRGYPKGAVVGFKILPGRQWFVKDFGRFFSRSTRIPQLLPRYKSKWSCEDNVNLTFLPAEEPSTC